MSLNNYLSGISWDNSPQQIVVWPPVWGAQWRRGGRPTRAADFEMFCNRGIYYKGWLLSLDTASPGSWLRGHLSRMISGIVRSGWLDPARNIAKENPKKLQNCSGCFWSKRSSTTLFPWRVERFKPDLTGPPQLIRGNSQILFAASRTGTQAGCITSRILLPWNWR